MVMIVMTKKISNIFILLALFSILTACASPSTRFWPTSDFKTDNITTENIITLSKIDIQGDLKDRKTNLFSPFLVGFKKQINSINLIDGGNGKHNFTDLELQLVLTTKSSLSAGDYLSAVPLVGPFAFTFIGGQHLNFNWDATIAYEFKDSEGRVITNGSFNLNGIDKYHPARRDAGLELLTTVGGYGAMVATYPKAEAQIIVGDALMNVVGEEVAKRLSSDPIKSFLLQREKLRDGMDIKTYVEFMDKKKRFLSEREIANAKKLKELNVQIIDNEHLAEIKSGTVMVLGIGVSKYKSSQIPTLKYADKDSQRIVNYFRNRYKLSDDRAMLLINEEATAAKISRFITKNAMKLLDKNDTFILYFGGHGAPDEDSTSSDNDGLKKYLLLHDSEIDSLPLTALSLNNLASLLEKLPCKRIVILLDSCFAGTAGAQTLAKLKSIRISEKSYKNITELSGKGRVILAASRENQVSHEDDRLQAGVFTYYLLEGLKGKADTKGDGSINILGLYEYVTREVSIYTQKKQTPVFRGSLDANIIF